MAIDSRPNIRCRMVGHHTHTVAATNQPDSASDLRIDILACAAEYSIWRYSSEAVGA